MVRYDTTGYDTIRYDTTVMSVYITVHFASSASLHTNQTYSYMYGPSS